MRPLSVHTLPGLLAVPPQFLGILSSAQRVRRNDLPAGALNADDR